MRDDLALLDLMMEDQKVQGDLYRPGPYWVGYCGQMRAALARRGLGEFRSDAVIGKGFADTCCLDPLDLMPMHTLRHRLARYLLGRRAVRTTVLRPYYERLRWWANYAQDFKDRYYNRLLGPWFSDFSRRHSLPETTVGRPTRVVDLGGQAIGEGYLSAFARIDNRKDRVDFRQTGSVLEIGGGYGAMAHSLLHLFPNIRKYVYIDVPPTLYVGTQYLKHFFGESVVSYELTRHLDRIAFSPDDRLEIFPLCPWQIERFASDVDLFWNSASFQEMPEPAVANYIRHIVRLLRKDGRGAVCIDAYDDNGSSAVISLQRLMLLLRESLALDEVRDHVGYQSEHSYVGGLKPAIEGR